MDDDTPVAPEHLASSMASPPRVTEAWMRVNIAVDTTCIQHVFVPRRSVVSSACKTGKVRSSAPRAAMKSRRRRDASQ
jgi:hypothetical protein